MPDSHTSPGFALGTFSIAGAPPFPGLVMGERVVALNALVPVCKRLGHELRYPGSLLSLLDEWQLNESALRQAAAYLADRAEALTRLSAPLGVLTVHAPLEQPRQIFCSGANYRKHVIDLIVDQARDPEVQGMSREQRLAYAKNLMDERCANGTPYIFSKTWSSITGPFDPIPLPANVEQPDWELELVAVIGKPAFHVSRAAAHDYIAGYTICNDITNRELVHRQDLKAIGSDWVMSKCLPGYLPMGPYLVPACFVSRPQDVRITLRLNGEIKQDESTADMIFDIARLLEYLTSRVRLWPGDLLLTGSPSGNGSHTNRFLRPGDVLEGSIEGLGTQRNPCVAGGQA
jgi:2-keto-4-pentenoate hydratase/2-oxohepta-3-ene-1,7-dioic acid hydratase in catechol pathway